VPWVIVSLSQASDRERLARVAADENIDGWGIGVELAHVREAGDSGEAALEDGAAGRLGLAHPDQLAVEPRADAEVETADAGEEGAEAQRHRRTASRSRVVAKR
jgi:hypothetical protein